MKTMVISVGESATEGDLEIRLRQIVMEVIAPSGDGVYPAGSGVSASFRLKKGNETADIILSKLSEGYESKLYEEWKGYTIQLVEADDKRVKIIIRNSR